MNINEQLQSSILQKNEMLSMIKYLESKNSTYLNQKEIEDLKLNLKINIEYYKKNRNNINEIMKETNQLLDIINWKKLLYSFIKGYENKEEKVSDYLNSSAIKYLLNNQNISKVNKETNCFICYNNTFSTINNIIYCSR